MVRRVARDQHRSLQRPRNAGQVGRLTMNTLVHSCPSAAPGTAVACDRSRAPRWRTLRAPALTAIVATLAVLGLLTAFQRVVAAGVQQSESRHRADAAHADGVWRCNHLRDLYQRRGCHAQLEAARSVDATLNDNGLAASRTVAAVTP